MLDLFREILQTLGHNKLRTALTGLAVAWGIFMLIVLLGMGNGVTNAFKEQAMDPGSQKINVWGGRTSKPYHGYREGRRITLKGADMESIADEHSGFVNSVTSTMWGNSGAISAGTKSISESYCGVYPQQLQTASIDLVAGRLINDRDMAAKAKVVILPQTYAKQLFPPDGNALGKRVGISGLSWKVVGIYDAPWNRNIYIPFTTAKMIHGNTDDLSDMSIMLKNLETEKDGEEAEKSIRATLAGRHDFNPEDESAVWTWNQFSQGLKGLHAINILNASIWILGLLTLLSGIVGISNIMFVSVKERTHEIGIRRAIGAKPRSILTQVIAESVAITTLFGYIGIVTGILTTQLLNYLFQDAEIIKNASVSLNIAVEVTIVLIIAGAMAGLFPALKALKVKPVEALRDE